MTYEIDLFGNERPARSGCKAQPVALNMFDAAAETLALRTGRARSQERADFFASVPPGEWACACGGSLGTSPLGKCRKCKK